MRQCNCPERVDTNKQKTPNIILETDYPPKFQIQVANGQVEKPIATATPKLEIGHTFFAEHSVVMKKLTGPIIDLHFMRNNSVVTDTTHSLIHFPHFTMQAKTASSQTTTKPQPVINDGALTILSTTKKKQSQPAMTIRRNGTQQGLWHHWRSLRNSNFADFPFNVEIIWQKNSS